MFRRFLPPLLAALSLAACTGESPDDGPEPSATAPAEASSGPSTEDLAVWAGEFCDAPDVIPPLLYVPFTAMAHGNPTTEDDRQPLIDGLNEAIAALEDAETAAAALPESPAPEGAEALEQYRADLEARRSSLAEYAELAPVYPAGRLDDLFVLAGIAVTEFPYSAMMYTYLEDAGGELWDAAQTVPACEKSEVAESLFGPP